MQMWAQPTAQICIAEYQQTEASFGLSSLSTGNQVEIVALHSHWDPVGQPGSAARPIVLECTLTSS